MGRSTAFRDSEAGLGVGERGYSFSFFGVSVKRGLSLSLRGLVVGPFGCVTFAGGVVVIHRELLARLMGL